MGGPLTLSLSKGVLLAAAALTLSLSLSKARAFDWTANETIRHYTVTGDTGIALYRQIGEKGPKAGVRRAIALTEWDLKWRRDYRPEGGGCRLASVKPFVTITMTLPKASGPVAQGAGDLSAKWQRFAAGIAAHERVHADLIGALVDEIIALTDGLEMPGDPRCTAIQAEVQRRVKGAFDRYQAANQAYEAREMAAGGNVEALVSGLVE